MQLCTIHLPPADAAPSEYRVPSVATRRGQQSSSDDLDDALWDTSDTDFPLGKAASSEAELDSDSTNNLEVSTLNITSDAGTISQSAALHAASENSTAATSSTSTNGGATGKRRRRKAKVSSEPAPPGPPKLPPPLFATVEEGRLRLRAFDSLRKVHDPEFELFTREENPQSLLFLKLHKVGGTSVALALDNATAAYSLRQGPRWRNAKAIVDRSCDDRSYDLFYGHSRRSQWLDLEEKCLPGAVRVTLFREPTSRFISRSTWMWNRAYFINHPERPCDYSKGDTRKSSNHECYDHARRHTATLRYFLKRLPTMANRTGTCGETCTSITRSESWDAETTIAELKEDYGLYATTEHLDEFLVLLALRFGWSIDTMLYEKCKDQGEVKVSPRDLVGDAAWALEYIKERTVDETEVYTFAKRRFEAFTQKLGPEFEELVAIFKRRLKAFQEEARRAKNDSKKWVHHPLVLMC